LSRDIVRSYRLSWWKVPFLLEELASILTVLGNNADSFLSSRARFLLIFKALPGLTSPLCLWISLALDFDWSIDALLVANPMHSFIPVALRE